MRRRRWLPTLLAGLCWSLAASAAVLRIGNGNEPETLDPHRAEGVSAGNILRDLYEGLTSVAADGTPVPGAAERWTISADGREYQFQLRAGLRWSNGDPLVAEDFVAGLRRSIAPTTGSAYARMFAPIEGAEAVLAGQRAPETLGAEALDDTRLRIRLQAPTPYFLGLLAHPTAYPVHRPSLQRWGEGFARPGRLVSNGAYRLEDWVLQSQVRLLRNRHYWNDAATGIDEIQYRPSEDAQGELRRYRADELDITTEIPLQQAGWLRRHHAAELRIAPYLGTYYYGFNLGRAPFRDEPGLRRALAMAVDRELIVAKLMNGLALPAYSFLPPGLWNYRPQRPDWADWPRERRLAEARQLLAEAGYGPERPLEVELRYNTHDDHRRIATVIAAMWKQWLGVQTRLVNEEFKVFIQNRNRREITQLFRASWIADYDDASAFTDILHSRHGQNDMAYDQPGYDALLASAAAEPDAARRRQQLEAAERLLLRDWPVLPIYTYVSKHLVKPWVQGWQDNALDIHYSKNLRLVGRPPELDP